MVDNSELGTCDECHRKIGSEEKIYTKNDKVVCRDCSVMPYVSNPVNIRKSSLLLTNNFPDGDMNNSEIFLFAVFILITLGFLVSLLLGSSFVRDYRDGTDEWRHSFKYEEKAGGRFKDDNAVGATANATEVSAYNQESASGALRFMSMIASLGMATLIRIKAYVRGIFKASLLRSATAASD